MRLHRFFIGDFSETKKHNGTNDVRGIVEGSTITYAQGTHQWQRVFRFGTGDRVLLFDGSGYDYLCEIKEYQGETTILNVVSVEVNNVKPNRNVILVSALVKKDTFEWIAEKATELGVSQLIPLLAERSEKKSINEDRLEKIIIEASEQSGRGTLMKLDLVKDLSFILKDKRLISHAIVFEPTGRKFEASDFGPNVFDEEKPLTVFIGPEGGWSEKELELFVKAGIPAVSLGPQILRAETAVIAALSLVVF